MQVGSKGQFDHCCRSVLRILLAQGNPYCLRGSFSSPHGMLCLRDLWPELRGKLERT